MKNIVIVDDVKTQLMLLELLLNQRGFEPVKFSSPLEALDYMKTNQTDLLITDFNMPEMNGLELIREAKRVNPTIYTSVVSSFADEISTLQAECESLNSPLLRKPFDSLAFQEFMQPFYNEEKREVFCIRNKNNSCVLRDKVASNFCMICCLDDIEEDKEAAQSAIDAIDDFLPNYHMLLHVSAKLSYMANTLSVQNYGNYSDVFIIIKHLVVILREEAQNISDNDDIMMLVTGYLRVIRMWLYDTCILEKPFDELDNNHDSIKADFLSIQHTLGISNMSQEEVTDIDDMFF